MTNRVSDFLSNVNDQIVNAAKIVGKSKKRQEVFEAIYKGQQQRKTVQEIMAATGMSHGHVLTEAKKLGPLVEKDGSGFRKQKDLATSYKKILAYARDKKKRDKVPTKFNLRGEIGKFSLKVAFPSGARDAVQITIDDIDAFAKAKKVKASRLGPTSEKKIKDAFAKLLGDGGIFKDWGGEKSDLYTDKGKVRGKRRPVAIAFKGKGTKGKLVPAKMGRNGDQVGRLFDEPAEAFLIVYCGQIDSSIVSQMKAFAIGKALAGQKIFFGVIDADDLGKLAVAYPSAFAGR